MTMISVIRYEVEIQPPSSMPAPIAPWISGSASLVIWMFSTAMNAPSVEPITASQVLSVTGCELGGMARQLRFRLEGEGKFERESSWQVGKNYPAWPGDDEARRLSTFAPLVFIVGSTDMPA